MSDITQLIHGYLRHNKKFPHVFCAGCGHGIIMGSLVRSIHQLNLPKDDVVIVAGIGCSGRLAAYVDFNTVHTTHGRALTFATGIKMSNPRLKVICIMGDGDAMSIGGNHFIHAARRNIGITTIMLNNFIYGMTGGQCSSATPMDDVSMTTPYGSLEQPFDSIELIQAAGANFVARGTSFHVRQLDQLLQKGIAHPGFSFIEVLSPCPTQYGRKNGFRSAVEMYKWLKKSTYFLKEENTTQPFQPPSAPPAEASAPIEKAKPEPKGHIPLGIFQDRQKPSLEERYEELCRKLQKPAP